MQPPSPYSFIVGVIFSSMTFRRSTSKPPEQVPLLRGCVVLGEAAGIEEPPEGAHPHAELLRGFDFDSGSGKSNLHAFNFGGSDRSAAPRGGARSVLLELPAMYPSRVLNASKYLSSYVFMESAVVLAAAASASANSAAAACKSDHLSCSSIHRSYASSSCWRALSHAAGVL